MVSLILLGPLAWLSLFFMAGGDTGTDVRRSIRGGTKVTSVAPAPQAIPSAAETAKGISEARLQYDRPIAQQELDIQKEFAPQLTQLMEGIRQQYFPQEQGVREALGSNILGSLQDPTGQLAQQTQLAGQVQQAQAGLFPEQNAMQQALQQRITSQIQSPTGITPEQQSAQDAIRARALQASQEAQRTRANLGGGLFGGRAASAEQADIQNLLNQFAVEDIDRQERAGINALQFGQTQQQINQQQQQALQQQVERERLNAIQSALPFLQILFPDVNISPFQFQSPVPQPGQQLQAAVTGRGQDINAAMAAQQAQQANQSALYGALGQLGGAAVGGLTGTGGWLARP